MTICKTKNNHGLICEVGIFAAPVITTALWTAGTIAVSATILQFYAWRKLDALSFQAKLVVCALIVTTEACVVWRIDNTGELVVVTGFAATGIPLAYIDARTLKLPNKVVLLTYLITTSLGVAVAIAGPEWEMLSRALVASAAFFLFYATLFIVFADQLGGGDLKVSGVVGFVLGSHSIGAAVTGLVLIWLINAAFLFVRKAKNHGLLPRMIPHGPFMIVGALAAILLSP